MSADSPAKSSYDDFPYHSYPYSSSHPGNLAALATLFSMAPAEVSKCRVLEIGCAAGGNLIPMASQFPEASFLGLDASGRQVDEGRETVRELSLSNIELRHQDINDFGPDEGEFDYIICHGVYSWVPSGIQTKIMQVCRDHLAEHGIAYISYNTYPGWYLRQGVREMMSFHAAGFEQPQEKIDQSRALVDFLADAVYHSGDAYERLLHEELNIIRTADDSYIYHEHLEEHNAPVFFHQFVSRAEEQGLRFLCEANLNSMMASGFDEKTQETLTKVAPNLIQMEQYLDFLRNRKFRQSLLCHGDTSLDRNIDPLQLLNLVVSAPLSANQEDPDHPKKVFSHASGYTLETEGEIQDLGLERLAELWPGDIRVSDLVDEVYEKISEQDESDLAKCRLELCEMFVQLYSSGIAYFSTESAGCSKTFSDQPKTTELIRHMATRSDRVTNLKHESVYLKAFELELIKHLDGETHLDDIARKLIDGGITLQTEDAEEETFITPTVEQLREAIDIKVEHLARAALLEN